jgi:excinuclease UvrABC ATPase subunit
MSQATTPCDFCKGSGVIGLERRIPDFEDYVWCPHCEAGRAKAERVSVLVARSLPRRVIKAA